MEIDPGLSDTRAVFGRVWGAALARVVGLFPEEGDGNWTPGCSKSPPR